MVASVFVLSGACGGAALQAERVPPAPVAPTSDAGPCACRWVHLPISIRFAARSSAVHPDDDALIAEVAQVVDARPSVVAVRVEGHSAICPEERGDQALSEARADAVRDRLVAHGVPSRLLRSVGYATTMPRKGTSPRTKEVAERCGPDAPTPRTATWERRVEFSVRVCERESSEGPEVCPDQPDPPDRGG